MGPATEFVESIKDAVNSDHLYSRNTPHVDTTTNSFADPTSKADLDTSHVACENFLDDLFPQQSDYDKTRDLGSDGNRSPMSDSSYSLSPDPDSTKNQLSWDDTFTDLFPELMC